MKTIQCRMYIMAFILIFPATMYSWKLISIKESELEKHNAPTFKSMMEEPDIPLGQCITIRFTLKNPHKKDIVIIPSFVVAPMQESYLAINIFNYINGKSMSPYYGVRGNDVFHRYLLLNPNDYIYGDFILSYNIISLGTYAIKSYYSWRYSKSLNPFDWDSVAKAKDITFQVISPTGVDKKVFDYVNDIEMLYCLQDYSMVMPSKDNKKLDLLKMKVKKTEIASFVDKYFSDEHDKIQNMRKYIITNYPKSSYVKNILFSYAMDYKIYKQFNKAIESYQEFVKRYPTSWFVDEALFNMAECQIELGKLDEAKKTIEKVLHMEADGSIQLKAKRIKRNLAKGYKTLDEIYAH